MYRILYIRNKNGRGVGKGGELKVERRNSRGENLAEITIFAGYKNHFRNILYRP
jgi:hypothetical protein